MTIAIPLGPMAGDAEAPARAPAPGLLGRVVSGCAEAAARRWRARQLRIAVADMNDYMLQDVGLRRTPAGQVIRLWRRDV